jgi:hypothetical protein
VAHVRQNESGFSAEATKLGFECLAFGLAAAGAVARPMPVRAPVMRITGAPIAVVL